ncbi:MAG: hypothetical protein WD652_00955 [Acidimicrobiia bacterium]
MSEAANGSRRFVLLGDPVGGSRSPAIHQAAFETAGIDGHYQARRVDLAGLGAAIGEIRSGAIDGANITMPYKSITAGLVDELDEDARRAGAVNTIVPVHDRLMGRNTDVVALRWALASSVGTVLILGAGGAAKAAAVAAAGRDTIVSARRPAAAEAMAVRFGLDTVAWGDPVEGAIVINATPLGMAGETLPPEVVDGARCLLDLAYGVEPTPAVAEALRRSLPVVDGIDLLVAQAAAAFTIWTGVAAPFEAMMRAARPA